jgi:hypothetical protein
MTSEVQGAIRMQEQVGRHLPGAPKLDCATLLTANSRLRVILMTPQWASARDQSLTTSWVNGIVTYGASVGFRVINIYSKLE